MFTLKKHPFAEDWRSFVLDLAIGLAASLASAAVQLMLDRVLAVPITPLITSVAAVIASAAWAGPLAGWTATALTTAWCGAYLATFAGYRPFDIAVLCGILAFEGVLLTVGSASLFRLSRDLARTNIRQKQLVDTAAEGILVQSPSGIITYANARMREMLAVGRSGLEGRKFQHFVYPEDVAAERIRLQRRGAGSGEQFDRRLRRADGTEIWVLSCSNPMFDECGEFTGVLSMMTDITERKAAETALRRSEERFRSLFENVLEGVYQSTPDGRILAANPMLLKMLDLKSESEMNDVNITKDLYMDPKVRSRCLAILEREGSFQNMEYELRRRDGRVLTVLENARAVRDAEGNLLYYEGTLTDITERKQVEERLRQSQKTEALAGLAAGVAEDFNSIMTVITGYCELLATDGSLSPGARDHAFQALKAAETAGMVTRQLVSLNLPPCPDDKTVDVSRVIREREASLAHALGRDIQLRFCLEEAAHVSIDERQIEQVIVNLTTNSREAMPGGGVIEIRTETIHLDSEFTTRNHTVEPGAYVKLTVRDSGVGIPSELIHNLTDPMFSMGKSRVTGLGLPTVHAIAMRHGGFVTAESTPGMGSTFCVYIPLAGPQRALSGALRGARPGETILIVEQEPLARELSRDMLQRLGYCVIPAATAEEAERLATSRQRLDLLITSVKLGRESGAELAQRLTSSRPSLKVLLLSGRAEQAQLEQPGALPGAEHLRKPFSDESLGRKVRQILDAR